MVADASGADTATRIVEATRRVLIEHGYDDLSMAKIATEFDGNQSLIHYHFDSREGLLVALLERERELYVEFFGEFPDDPEKRLDRLLDTFVGDFTEWAEESGMAPRFVELSAAATDSEPIQTALRDLYTLFREELERAIADGIEAGVFEPVDPAPVARLLLAGNESAMQRWLVGEPDEIPAIADAIERYVLAEVRR
jgi:AcrR family transcriptional regulator